MDHEHFCEDPSSFPPDKFLQAGRAVGTKVLIVGEAPAPNGWRKSGRAFYSPDGKLLSSGRNLNNLLQPFGLTIETCGFTDLVKCYVGKDRRLLFECGRKCWPIFLRQLHGHEFKLVVTLGVTTLEILNTAAGVNFPIGELSTFRIADNEYALLPLYHTSPINPHNHTKNRGILQRWHDDLQGLLTGAA